MRTILKIAQDLAPDLGIEQPQALILSQEQADIDLLLCIVDAGQELQSRFDWPQLRKPYTISGAGNSALNLPIDYSRMVKGWSVTSSGQNVRGSLSDEEFNRLVPIAGQPRYYRSSNTSLELWPYINVGTNVSILYVTMNWLVGDKSAPTIDIDTPLFDDILVSKGAKWRFLRMQGEDFVDEIAEYEASLNRYSSFARSERLP
jgi:hypothetical protein